MFSRFLFLFSFFEFWFILVFSFSFFKFGLNCSYRWSYAYFTLIQLVEILVNTLMCTKFPNLDVLPVNIQRFYLIETLWVFIAGSKKPNNFFVVVVARFRVCEHGTQKFLLKKKTKNAYTSSKIDINFWTLSFYKISDSFSKTQAIQSQNWQIKEKFTSCLVSVECKQNYRHTGPFPFFSLSLFISKISHSISIWIFYAIISLDFQ